jgi:hypothetical protein
VRTAWSLEVRPPGDESWTRHRSVFTPEAARSHLANLRKESAFPWRAVRVEVREEVEPW